MSTVLSYSARNFTILITDTRSIRFDKSRNQLINDNTLKIHYIDNLGFITGIGIGDLAQRTFNNLAKLNNFLNDSLYNSYKLAYQSIRNEKECTAGILEIFNHTSVIVSSRYSIILFSPELLKHLNSDAVVLKKNYLDIQFPFDISTEDINKIQQQGSRITSDSLRVSLKEMLKIFKTISFLSKNVSDICSIAIMGSNIESPFFIQQKVDNIIEHIDDVPFDAIQNEFDQYRKHLISWEII